MEKITQRIRQISEAQNLSINQLEKAAKLTNASIDKWEKGQKPSYDKLYRVAETLKVSLDWLITGKESGTLTPDEEKLVELYRLADERGKRRILRGAEDEAEELRLSSSKIG